MITYEALLGEISLIQAARDSLPSNVHIGALFDLQIRRLWEQAEAIASARQVRVGTVLSVNVVSSSEHVLLSLASSAEASNTDQSGLSSSVA